MRQEPAPAATQESTEMSGNQTNTLKKAFTVGTAALAILAPNLHANTAHAETTNVGCYGDWCSGKDPMETNCANDAVTISDGKLVQQHTVVDADGNHRVYVEKGLIDLRWSPTCKTKWARLRLKHPAEINGLIIKQDTNYQQEKKTFGFTGATGPGIFYTKMIYSPGRLCYAYVSGPRLESNSTNWE